MLLEIKILLSFVDSLFFDEIIVADLCGLLLTGGREGFEAKWRGEAAHCNCQNNLESPNHCSAG